MRFVKAIVFLTALAAALWVSGYSAGAQQVPRFEQEVRVEGAPVKGSLGDHVLTFSAPVALPGISLGAGTYIFRRPTPDVLQVLNPAQRESYAMLFTSPIVRNEGLDKYEVRFAPSPVSGSPMRVTAWFAPGSSTGQLLTYRDMEEVGDER
jgi:hypothetical protein